MTRTFSPQDLIQLPKMTAEETYALDQQLLAQAKEAGLLPATVEEARGEVEATAAILGGELAARQKGLAPVVDPAVARSADRMVDTAWGATRDWVASWARLAPADPALQTHVKAINEGVFPDGLGFLTLPFVAEWTESDTRLKVIAEKGLEGSFHALGGTAFLEAIKRAHDAYGKALHITTARPQEAPDANVRPAMETNHDAIRDYVTQVMASVKRKEPATAALADRLLKPLTDWESNRERSGPAADPVPADTGTPDGG